jgi:hypothetical protein
MMRRSKMEWIETAVGLLSLVGIGLLVFNLYHLRNDEDDAQEEDVSRYEKLQYLESSADFAVKAAQRLEANDDDKYAYACGVVKELLDSLEVEQKPELIDAAVRKAYYEMHPHNKIGF